MKPDDRKSLISKIYYLHDKGLVGVHASKILNDFRTRMVKNKPGARV